MGEVSGNADRVLAASGDLAAIAHTVHDDAAGIAVEITRLLRSRLPELDRRSARLPVRLGAVLTWAGGSARGLVVDISTGGARLQGDAARFVADGRPVIAVGTRGRLTTEGLPDLDVEVAGLADDALRLHCVTGKAAQAAALAAAIARLQPRPEAA
jgi:hypothetical protein